MQKRRVAHFVPIGFSGNVVLFSHIVPQFQARRETLFRLFLAPVVRRHVIGFDPQEAHFPLPPDAEYILLSVLATVANQGEISDYAEEHDVAVAYQFVGDCYMPMQESFVRFTELSSRETYYDNQIVCDATLRVVDPAGTAGLDHFNVERTVDTYNRFAGSLETRVLVTARKFPGIDETKLDAAAAPAAIRKSAVRRPQRVVGMTGLLRKRKICAKA